MFDINFNLNVSIEEKKRGYVCILNDYAIYKENEPIEIRTDLVNHSPTGLSWGYNTSGCSQAALAILCNFTNDEEFSIKVYMDFKKEILYLMPEKDCLLKFADIQKWVELKKHIIKIKE